MSFFSFNLKSIDYGGIFGVSFSISFVVCFFKKNILRSKKFFFSDFLGKICAEICVCNYTLVFRRDIRYRERKRGREREIEK